MVRLGLGRRRLGGVLALALVGTIYIVRRRYSTGLAEFARKVQMQGPRIIYFVYVRSSLRTVAKTREYLFRVYARTVYCTRSTAVLTKLFDA